MEPFFNGQSPAAPVYSPAASSFTVPVPVFPTTQSFQQQQQQQPVQVGEMQPAANYFPTFQTHSPPAPNSNAPNHPPYYQMITEAITALREREGSSRQAIAKYIELFYPNLPPTHTNLLTQYLKHMKDSGQILMVKHSYMLPGSAPEVLADNAASVPKRSRGRPPKLRRNASEVQQTQFQQDPPADEMNAQGSYSVPESVFASIGLVDGVTESDSSVPRKRPGRPKKVQGFDHHLTDSPAFVPTSEPVNEVAASGVADPPVKRRPGRPSKNGSLNVGGHVADPVISPRGRGRPKQNARVYSGKPRGRPRRNVDAPTPLNSVNTAGGAKGVPNTRGDDRAVPVERKRRPLRQPTRYADEPRRPRQPLGRQTQNAPAATAHVSNLQQLLAYQGLRTSLELVQSRIKHNVEILKPFLVESEEQASSTTDANAALDELEELSTLDITAASSLHSMTLLPPEQD